MNTILHLSIRNLKLFLRDKALVFFSFLSVIIILGLYVMFLGEIQIDNVKNMIGFEIPQIDALVYAWMLPGLISIATFTLALGNMGRLVDDAKDESLSDFLVSPVKRSQLILSYLVATILISFVISMIMFTLSIFIVKLKGGPFLDIYQIASSIGVIVLLIISSSLLALIIASFIKSQNTYGVVNSIVGTFIGFVTGAYMPMGIMPVIIQDVFNSLPVSQGASILRQIYLKPILADVFNGAPTSMLADYRYFQGIDLKIFGHILSIDYMLMSIVISIVVLFAISLLRFKSLSKRV